MKVGRISYANTEPFFHYWNSPQFELQPGTPKELADAAKRGEVVAGPLPLVECWELEKEFMPLGDWSIASRERCRSVFVLSKQPFSELDHVMIGVTKESATSVKLCETLIRHKYGNDVRMRKGLQMEDAAWLVIGDQALHLTSNPALRAWPHVTDLATEWWQWKKLPFVFARWVVRRDLAPALLAEFDALVKTNFEKGMAHVKEVADAVAPKLNLSADFLVSYFNEFVYQMDDDAKKSEHVFRDLVKQGAPHVASAAH